MPAWALRYEYAAEFKQDVRTVGVLDGRTWFRWLMLRRAKAARAAWEKSKLKDGWATLSEYEAGLIRWTQERD